MADESTPPVSRRREPSKIFRHLGIAGSLVWCGLLLLYALRAWAKIKGLEPNELGDLCAGAFAPLALFWLVLGFFQQGQELRNSADALWLQGEELRNSVEQARELVNVTRDQLAFESARLQAEREEAVRNAQPVLEVRLGGNSSSHQSPSAVRHDVLIINHGRDCTDVKLLVDGKEWLSTPLLGSGKGLSTSLIVDPQTPDREHHFEVTYLDGQLVAGRAQWSVVQQGATFHIIPMQPATRD